MRPYLLASLLFLCLSACSHSRFTRTKHESLMSTIRDLMREREAALPKG